jgi:hypothetical protein
MKNNVYLPVSLDCPFLISSSVSSNVYLPVSLDCPFLISSSVSSNVYLHVSFGLSVLDLSFCFPKGKSRMDNPETQANKR